MKYGYHDTLPLVQHSDLVKGVFLDVAHGVATGISHNNRTIPSP